MLFQDTAQKKIRGELKNYDIEDIPFPKFKKTMEDDSITDIARQFYHKLEMDCFGKHRIYKNIDGIIVEYTNPIIFYVLIGKLNAADFFRFPHNVFVPLREKISEDSDDTEIIRFEKLPHVFI